MAGKCGCGNQRDTDSKLCRTCRGTRERSWQKTKKFRLQQKLCVGCGEHPSRAGKRTCAECSLRRVQHGHKKLGVSPEDFQRRFAEQQGLCAICELPMKAPCQDHNHETKQIRDLLCHRCNRVLGLGKESPFLFRALAAYVERWSSR